jgi:hypothetical protein
MGIAKKIITIVVAIGLLGSLQVATATEPRPPTNQRTITLITGDNPAMWSGHSG